MPFLQAIKPAKVKWEATRTNLLRAGLRGAASFRYLSKSSTLTLPGVDDAEGLRSTLDAMAIVGLNEVERQAVLQTVAAVLHLGNISFASNDADESVPEDAEALQALAKVAHLLGVRCLLLFLVSASGLGETGDPLSCIYWHRTCNSPLWRKRCNESVARHVSSLQIAMRSEPMVVYSVGLRHLPTSFTVFCRRRSWRTTC